MLLFFLGSATALLFTGIFYLKINRKLKVKEEEVQRLGQEKQVVVDFMHSISGAIIGEKNRQALFQKIIHAAIVNTGAMSACIFERISQNRYSRIAVEGLFPPQSKASIDKLKKSKSRTEFIENAFHTETYSLGEGLIGHVAKSGKAILIANAKNDPRVIQHEDPALHTHSLMVAPVHYDNKLIAILAVANPLDGVPFNEMDFSLLESLSNQVGLAIQNSNTIQLQIEKSKIDLDLQLAQNIQNLLLPSEFPKNSPLDFATYYSPAQKIGGDLYDVFNLDDTTLGVVIADVSGKGIPASIVMAICQTHLKHLIKTTRSPAKILKALNKEMLISMRPGMFVTLVLGIIDLKENNLTLARAGHEAPIFYDHAKVAQEDRTSTIKANGMAVGIVPSNIFDAKIEDFTRPFNQGDILILFTDGLTEIENKKHVEFSNKRLIEVIDRHHDKSAENIVSNIVDAIEKYTGSDSPQDDQTLLLVKNTGQK